MQHDMRKLINLVESLNESGNPILDGKLDGREISLPSGVSITLHSPNRDTDDRNQPMTEYQIAADGEPTDLSATYYSDGMWLILRDGSDLETGELMGKQLSSLLAEVPDFAEYENDDEGGWDDDAHGLTAAERNR